MRSYVDRLLPYLMVNVTRHHISLFPPITNPLYCTRHTVSVSLAHHAQILLGYPTVYRVTQQNWNLLRTMRLHIYQAMGIPICFSRVDKTRVTFSQRALVLLKELNNNNALPENDRFLVRSYDSSKQTLSTIIRHYADSDVLVLHSYEERLNIWFLRSFSVVYVLDKDCSADRDGHYLYRKIAEKMSCDYRVVNATKEDADYDSLQKRWVADRAFIEKKFAVSLVC